MNNKGSLPVYTVLGQEYTLSELRDAVALCYSQIVRFGYKGAKQRLRQSVYNLYTEAMRKYRDVLKGGID